MISSFVKIEERNCLFLGLPFNTTPNLPNLFFEELKVSISTKISRKKSTKISRKKSTKIPAKS
jgi:hypothetical protein